MTTKQKMRENFFKLHESIRILTTLAFDKCKLKTMQLFSSTFCFTFKALKNLTKTCVTKTFFPLTFKARCAQTFSNTK